MENRYNVKIDLKSREIKTDARFRVGDTDSGTMEFELTNSAKVQPITGQNITFNFQKGDGKIVTQDMTNGVKIIDGEKGIFEVVLKNETLQYAGKVNCNITFTKENEITSTIGFIFAVDKSINASGLSVNYINQIETKITQWQTEFDLYKDVMTSESNVAKLQENINITNANMAKNKAENLDSINTMGSQLANMSPKVTEHLDEVTSHGFAVSRDISIEGIQTIAIPFRAKSIICFGIIAGTQQFSNGNWSENGYSRVIYPAMGTGYFKANIGIADFEDASNNTAMCTVQNVTDIGLEILWSKTGTPTGTAELYFTATTH